MNKYACKDKQSIYLKSIEKDFRTPFFRDIDRILYSQSFQRYMDKTQVFSFKDNDHLTKRMTHVLYVSKIARTIGRKLKLNEDLIEAAALGHDLGHTPFGHAGEAILNDISVKEGCGYFNHNAHSVRLLMYIENDGKGKEITLQTLDAILCHNGEFVEGKYVPHKKTKEQFLKEYEETYTSRNMKKLIPMTLEGCVVRISDLIAYLGRDIEDAVRMNLISFLDVPEDIKKVLGTNNREIVNTIVTDIIKNSKGKDYIELSNEVYDAIKKLKDFNYKYIYDNAYTNEERKYLKDMLNKLFYTYLDDLKQNNIESSIVRSYLKKSMEYKTNTTLKRVVIDYIAGMTDDYALKEYNKIINNEHNKDEVEHEL